MMIYHRKIRKRSPSKNPSWGEKNADAKLASRALHVKNLLRSTRLHRFFHVLRVLLCFDPFYGKMPKNARTRTIIPRHPVIFSDDTWGVQSPPKSIVFRFHYDSQNVIGSLGNGCVLII